MKKILSLLFAGAFVCALCSTLSSCEKSESTEIKHATGTIVGSYSNGFRSLIIQVDHAYPVGKTINHLNLPGICMNLPDGVYKNVIQVQTNLSGGEINKRISFSAREFQEDNDSNLFSLGVGNAFCTAPSVPIYVVTDHEIIE
jgi:hypothetical protein